MNNKVKGLVVFVTGLAVLVCTLGFKPFMSYAMTTKYSCFGECQGITEDKKEFANKFIDYDALQEENRIQRLIVENSRK